ncbi:hypothetical protein [Cypionkella aquatica]|nr:hypothetical protein [Cypionkella aquatica]
MNSDQIKAAFRRAAKVSPLYRPFQLFKLATGGPHNRPLAHTFDFMESARGTLHWRELAGPDYREGVVTLLGHFTVLPDLILADDGQWLGVVEGAGADALGASYKIIVRRWEMGVDDHTPVIRNAAP